MQDINFILEEEEYVPRKKKTFWQRVKNRIWKLFCFVIASVFVSIVHRTIQRREEKRMYRKIIKKGIFWDTEYLIEKDNE